MTYEQRVSNYIDQIDLASLKYITHEFETDLWVFSPIIIKKIRS